jgi:CrcB protein
MMKLVLVMLGGALGTLGRYGVSSLFRNSVSNGFPVGTLVVNLAGSFIIGLLWGLFENHSATTRAFLFIGILGGFTTFSAYSIETLTLFREGNVKLALLNILANNVLGVLLALCGFALSRVLK